LKKQTCGFENFSIQPKKAVYTYNFKNLYITYISMSTAAKSLDLIVYGATGFTGKLIAK